MFTAVGIAAVVYVNQAASCFAHGVPTSYPFPQILTVLSYEAVTSTFLEGSWWMSRITAPWPFSLSTTRLFGVGSRVVDGKTRGGSSYQQYKAEQEQFCCVVLVCPCTNLYVHTRQQGGREKGRPPDAAETTWQGFAHGVKRDDDDDFWLVHVYDRDTHAHSSESHGVRHTRPSSIQWQVARIAFVD